MKTQSAKELGKTRAAFLQQLLSQGFDPAFAEKTADDAVKAGQVSDDDDGKVELDGQQRVDAEREAVRIAMATLESRLRVQDLVEMVPEGSPLRQLYSENYPRVFHDSGLESVEFIDRFPVLNGNYGYTRGESRPGATRLVSYRHPQSGNPVVYADVAQTEALFVKLDPVKVARWLENRGHKLFKWEDATSARLSILKSAVLPPVGSDPPGINTIGSDLLSLVHSYSHRMIRKTAVLAGLDRNSLSEFLVPLHLGFFVFAAARGGFVLGGLQAMYEAELVPLLEAVVFDEHRCALDPGCLRSGASCAACMHLGEPSCRWFNRFLDRGTLSGAEGYFQFESS
ncbi:hypothetical protein [Bremerella sp.]|uniref:hypothetical protein n=1 Tax=Bremerella sp. TaxID=2795602 RepID=UPI00391CEDB4